MKQPSKNLMADVSSNNGPVSITNYSRAGHVIVAIKATQGLSYVNPYHLDQANAAHSYGLTVVHYHFVNISADREAEIAHFRNIYNKAWRDGDYIAFDVELGKIPVGEISGMLSRFWLKTGHEPILYTYWSYFLENLHGVRFPGNRLWMANYEENAPIAPKPYNTVAKQYTDGEVGPEPHFFSGIGKCDGSIITNGIARRLLVRKIRTRRLK